MSHLCSLSYHPIKTELKNLTSLPSHILGYDEASREDKGLVPTKREAILSVERAGNYEIKMFGFLGSSPKHPSPKLVGLK